MRVIIIAVALAAAGSLPAHAQHWRPQPNIQREMQTDISGLDRQISRAFDQRAISRRDAAELRRGAARLQRQFDRFASNGLDRREVAQLEQDLNRLRLRLRIERRSWSDRR